MIHPMQINDRVWYKPHATAEAVKATIISQIYTAPMRFDLLLSGERKPVNNVLPECVEPMEAWE